MSKDASDYINDIYTQSPDSLMFREFDVARMTGEETGGRLSTNDDFFYVKLALINEYRS